MFYEYALIPDIFDPTLLYCDGRADIIVTEILRGVVLNGMIGDLHRGRLREHVGELVGKIPEADPKTKQTSPRKQILDCLELIKDRNRFVRHPLRPEGIPATPREWLDLALKSHATIRFDGLVTCPDCYDAANLSTVPATAKLDDALNAQFWVSRRTDCPLKSKRVSEFQRALVPVLRHAKKVTLIDPYIEPDKPRWINTVRLVQELIGRRVAGDAGYQATVHIHAGDPEPRTASGQLNLWENALKALPIRFKTSVSLWSMKLDRANFPDGPEMHDRYIITNQVGVSCPGGLDCYADPDKSPKAKATSTWSLIGWDAMSDHLAEFDENAGM